ncbi:MAG: hypothetical protein AAFV53_08935 [Myxococcota bacterium]
MTSLCWRLCVTAFALFGSTAAAQEVATVSPERPTQASAAALIGTLWEDLPDEGVVVYLSCVRPSCRGQVPEWFDEDAWFEGLTDAGLGMRSPDAGVDLVQLDDLREQNPAPPMFASALTLALAQADQGAEAMVFVHPNQRDAQLELSWELHDVRPPTLQGRGRLTVRIATPLPPQPEPIPRTPYRKKKIVWVGAGLVAVGVSAIGYSIATDLPSSQTGAGVLSVGGWAATMAGGMMMFIPAIRNDVGVGFRF